MSELDKSESRAISGMPGISEIPGLNNLTAKDNQKNYATLLIVITPHVIRGTQAAGHSPMMRVEKSAAGGNRCGKSAGQRVSQARWQTWLRTQIANSGKRSKGRQAKIPVCPCLITSSRRCTSTG